MELNWNKSDEFIRNPFRVDGITERFYETPGTRLYSRELVDPETGEATPLFTAGQTKRTLHDSKSYAKLFNDNGDMIRQLSASGKALFLFIAINLRVNWDIVYLNMTDVCVWMACSNSTFYRAMDELLEKKIIARKLKSSLEYWVNPNIFYNGDRVKMFKHLKQSIQDK